MENNKKHQRKHSLITLLFLYYFLYFPPFPIPYLNLTYTTHGIIISRMLPFSSSLPQNRVFPVFGFPIRHFQYENGFFLHQFFFFIIFEEK